MWLYVVEFVEYVYDVVQLNIGFWSYLFESLGVIGVRGRFNDNFHPLRWTMKIMRSWCIR